MDARPFAIVGLVGAAAMVIAIVYGVASGSFGSEFRSVIDLAWGRVTLVDLAAGLFIVGAWIGWREPSLARALPWWVAMELTGNLATAIYVARTALSSKDYAEFFSGTAR